MVNTIVKVVDALGTPIEGIPVKVHVTNCNPIGGLSNNYWLYGSSTNANGEYTFSNVQAYCQFTTYANYNNQNPNYTSGQGTTSTTLTQGGFVTITLQQIVQPSQGSNGQLTCPNGYSLVNNKCVQNATTVPQFNISFMEIIIIIVIILLIAFVIKYVRKNDRLQRIQ